VKQSRCRRRRRTTSLPIRPTPSRPFPASVPAGYLGSLLASAPADVRTRLAEIGEFVLGEQNLAEMRSRPLRDPGTPSGAVEHTDHLVPGRDGDPDVPVRLHRERGVTEPRPALISIHGGGYVIGSHLGDDGRFDKWSPALRCTGISVGYRLAPETPFPGPLEDCYAALAWAYRNAPDLGIDPGRIGIIGGSAGGGLAAGLALLARDRAEIPVALQVLSYPMLDDRQATRSGRAAAPRCGGRRPTSSAGAPTSADSPRGAAYPATPFRRAPQTWPGCQPPSSRSAISTACWTRTSTTPAGS
jgi:acetyl esterase/lipase